MPKFNIAYVPKFKTKCFIKLTEDFNLSAHSYCLGKHSLPHVTICQFFAEERQVREVWRTICSVIDDGEISLCFKKLSHLSFDETIFWLSLLPEYNKKLIDTFNVVSGIVESIRTDEYDPHLTLCNYHKDSMEPYFFEQEMQDNFELALGESDDAGQLVRIIYTYSSAPISVL